MSHSRFDPSQAYLIASFIVALCGCVWGMFWIPLRWLDSLGVGGAWTSLVFNLISLVAPLPFLMQRNKWSGFRHHVAAGLMLGTAFTLYTVSLVMTDVVHGVLLFYLTPVWSTLAARLLFGIRLTATRLLAIVLGLSGMALVLGVTQGLPWPRNPGDWLALASGVLWAGGTLHSYIHPAPGVAMPVFSFALGGVIASTVVLVLGHGLPMAEAGPLVANLPLVLLAALVFFVQPNFLILWAAQRLDPGRVGILLTTDVLIGAISAALLSGEPFGPVETAGTGLIVAAGLVEVMARQ